jgi:hypothetical protein
MVYRNTWSPAFNNAATATYTFTPNAGQCAATTTLIVTVTSSITPTFNPITVCTGAAIRFWPPTNGITGTWSPAFNSAVTATYTFTPNAGQCATTTTLTVTVTNSITPTFNPITVCTGAADPLQTTSTNGIKEPGHRLSTTLRRRLTPYPDAGQCAATTTLTVTVTADYQRSIRLRFALVRRIRCRLRQRTVLQNLVSGFQQCRDGDHVYTECRTMCLDDDFDCYGKSGYDTYIRCHCADLCRRCQSASDDFNEWDCGTWSPAFNNAATATYTFTPNTGQCASTTTLTVTVNPATIPTFAAIAPICAGAANPLLTTSTNGIVGTWSPAFNNAATATYTFTPNAGQCASTTTLTVTVNPATIPTFAIAPVCIGAANPLQGTSTNGIAGTWSPAFNNAATATYTSPRMRDNARQQLL